MVEKIDTRYEDWLNLVDFNALKRFSKLTGGPQNSVSKVDLATWMKLTLDNPERLGRAVASLAEGERALLYALRLMGGQADARLLRAAVFAMNAPVPGAARPYENFEDLVTRLLNTGMALNATDSLTPTRLHRSYSFNYSYNPVNVIFSDERILAKALPPRAPQDHLLEPVSAAEAGDIFMARSPKLITMELVSIFQIIERMGGVRVTMTGQPRVSELKKMAKQLTWNDGSLVDGTLVFQSAAGAFVDALAGCGALAIAGDRVLKLTPFAGDLIHMPIEEQARRLAFGLLQAEDWMEDQQGAMPRGLSMNYREMRAALLFALRALPSDGRGFFNVDEFSQALFRQVGHILSLRGIYYRPYTLAPNLDVKSLDANLKQRLGDWTKFERPWILQALKQWLYFFGWVELALSEGILGGFRLTALGRAALFPEQARVSNPETPTEDGPAWIIQPNFDVVAFLNRMTSAQLAFLERHAERASVQEHVAQYRLTRDSIYRGLEGGTRLDELIEALQAGAGRELPQNLLAEFREWAAQRERIVLHRAGTIAEFQDEKSRDLAMRAGLGGQMVGDRFLLLPDTPGKPLARIFKQTINYTQAPLRTLVIDEHGVVSYHRSQPDLVLTARIEGWTEPYGEGRRRFTKESVQAAVAAGRSLPSLLRLLDDRQAQIIPMIVRISLRAWAGEDLHVGLGRLYVLRVPHGELNYAVQQSERLRPFLITTITPGIYLVKVEQEEALRQALEDLGLKVGEVLSEMAG